MSGETPSKKLTIRKKLILIIMGITLTVLMIENGVQSVTSYYAMLSKTQERVEIAADLTAKNVASSLDFLDQDTAMQNLSSLAAEESIFRACVYDTFGTLFSDYRRLGGLSRFSHLDGTEKCPQRYDDVGLAASWNDLHVIKPISLNDKRMGWVFLDYDLTREHADFFTEQLVAIAIMICALALAYLLTSRLQRFITNPILHLSGVAEDLAEKKDFSIRAQKESNDELGVLVDAFNGMLEGLERRDKELVQAREEADNANEMKGQFLATMSHEIRTPMTGILGMAELLLGSSLSNRQEAHARTIVSSAESLLNIINDILDFSKIEAGKLDLDDISVDMLGLVDDIGLLYSVQAREKAVELVVYYQPGTEQFVFTDPVRVRQVISNLVSNAIKFTDKGYIVLSVGENKGADVLDDEVELLVQVKDTGVGMSQEIQNKIFDKFSQADASTTRKFGGTGLGLAICRSLVDMMGGHIWVESTKDKGSTFFFTLPCERNRSQVHKKPDVSILKNTKILIVDDLHINLKLISEQLESVGVRCGMALNGDDALREMESAHRDGDPFQLAIIDYLMPEMNGEMLACAIKDNPHLKDCCLVMLTAAGNPVVADSYAEKGFSAYMSKPIQQDALLEALAYVWRKYQEGETDILIQFDTQSFGRTENDAGPVLPGVKILMAEDNLVNQVFIQEIVQEMQCDLEIVQNGKEALECVQRESFDLVLMDCLMPVMDGFEATKEICKLKKTGQVRSDLPIVALTANAMKGDRERCLEAGMDEYLSKPIRKRELQEMIYHSVTGKTIQNSETQVSETEDSSKAQTPKTAKDILDRDAVETARSILKGKYDAMVTLYLDNSRERIEEINEAVKANDCEAVIRPAHTLKSTSRQMGALKLSDMAQDIELIAKALDKGRVVEGKDITYIAKSLDDLVATLSATQRAFEELAA